MIPKRIIDEAEKRYKYLPIDKGDYGHEQKYVKHDSKIDKYRKAFIAGAMLNEGWVRVEDEGYPPTNLGVLVFIPDEDFHITSGMWDISEKWVLLDEYRIPECEVTHWKYPPMIPKEYQPELDKNNSVLKAFKYFLLNSKKH